MDAIVTNGLSKAYGSTTAVDRLTISIPRGEIYGFLGPNGAGKTTTMRMLTGLVEPSAGHARICGGSIGDYEVVRQHVGYLPENPPLREYLTGREQLEYVASLRSLPAVDAAERTSDLLERFQLLEDADMRISRYSNGMRQKIGLIQSVLHEPDVLFLDEPTSGLDPEATKRMTETITELSRNDMTVLLSSHVLSVVEDIADTVGVLFQGSLVAEDTPAMLKDTEKSASLEEAFLRMTTEDPDRTTDR